MMSSRIVFLLGTLIAFAGNADAAATTCTGASGTFNTEDNSDNPSGASSSACKCVAGYINAASNAVVGSTALDCVKCAPGARLTAASDNAVAGVCTLASKGFYHAGGGSISAANTDSEAAFAACPFGGTTVTTGKNVVTDCVPDCATTNANSGAISNGAGLCICAAANYGKPVSANPFLTAAAAAQGCTGSAGFVQTAVIGSNKFTFTAHGLSNGAAVTYNNGGGTAATGLTHGTTYYVVSKDTDDFQVANNPGGAALTISGGNAAQYFTPAGIGILGSAAVISSSKEVVTAAAHGLVVGDQIKVYKGTDGTPLKDGDTAIVDGTVYYVKATSHVKKFQLSLTADGTLTVLTAGDAKNYFTYAGVKGVKNKGSTAVTGASEIQTAVNHGFSVGDAIKVYKGATALKDSSTGSAVNIVDGTTYYIESSSADDKFMLAATRGGAKVTLTAGADTNFFTYVTTGSTTNVVDEGGACPTNSEATPAATTDVADCKVKAGYYIKTKSDSVTDKTDIEIAQVPAASYGPGGQQATLQLSSAVTATKTACTFGGTSAAGSSVVSDCVPDCSATNANSGAIPASGTCICAANKYGAPLSTDNNQVGAALDGCTACPSNSEAPAGSDAIDDCKVKAGYYISAFKTSSPYATIIASPAGKYSAGGSDADEGSNDTPDTCPFGGTSAVGSDAITDCVPDCATTNTGSNAVAVGGTCVCAAANYGKPVSANPFLTAAAAAQGCTAPAVFTFGTTYASNANIAFTAHGLVVNAAIKYYKNGGAALTAGGSAIADGTTVYVKVVTDANSFTISSTAGGAALVLAAGNTAQYFKPAGLAKLQTADIASNVFTSAAHGLVDNMQVSYSKNGGPAATVSGAIADGTKYFVRDDETNTFKVALTPGGTAVAIVKGSGTPVDVFTYEGVKGTAVIATSAITAASDTIALASHGLTDGTAVTYSAGGALAAAGLTNGQTYFVRDAASGTFKVSATLGGSAVDITGTGNALQHFTYVTTGSATNVVDEGGACPTNSETTPAATTVLADCKVKAGYYIKTKSTSATDTTSIDIAQVVANSYGAGGEQATVQDTTAVSATTAVCPFGGTSAAGSTDASDCLPDCSATNADSGAIPGSGTCICAANKYGAPLSTANNQVGAALDGCTGCPSNSEAPAGSTAIADCKVKAGYYISAASTSAPYATIIAAEANKYNAGGSAANAAGTDTPTVCPFGGTSAVGSDALTDCVPDCATTNTGSNAVAVGGTCVCATTKFGTPLSVSNTEVGAALDGCAGACPTNSASAYASPPGGTRTIADCKVNPGYYIEQFDTSPYGIISQAPVNTYAPGGSAVDKTSNDAVPAACPFSGTSAVGSALTSCVPDCATTNTGSNAVAAGGTCVCATTKFGAPKDKNAGTALAAFNGCADACPTNSATAYAAGAGAGTIADCKVKAGYYISVASASAPYATIIAAEANKYSPGGSAANKATVDVPTACVSKSTSVAQSNAMDDCKVNAGYYLSVAGSSGVAGQIAKVPANSYHDGQTALDHTSADTPTACPYGGTSAVLSDAVTDCTPSCGTVADASSGTCVCKAGRTGTPTPTTGAVTGGCAATLCAANQKVTSNACVACAAGTTIAKDGDASGADTTCAATTCTADHYVSSNVCTDCAAGSTNAAGDDASGADTTCDIVSGASPLEVKLTSMISFLVLGFLALAM